MNYKLKGPWLYRAAEYFYNSSFETAACIFGVERTLAYFDIDVTKADAVRFSFVPSEDGEWLVDARWVCYPGNFSLDFPQHRAGVRLKPGRYDFYTEYK